MKIGILGARNVGRAPATTRVRAGHAVTITAPHAEEAGHVAAEDRSMETPEGSGGVNREMEEAEATGVGAAC
jgi:Trk K+ transport system NAD-binding subunit